MDVVNDMVVNVVFVVVFLGVNTHNVRVSVFVGVFDDLVDVKLPMKVFLGVNSHHV